MAVGTPTTNFATSATPSIGVPAGAASGQIAVIGFEFDDSAISMAARWPASFANLLDAQGTADGARYGLAWKRLSAGDTGSYTLASGTSVLYAAFAVLLTGRHATNPPVLSANSIQNTAQSSPVAITANGLTLVAGDDVLFISMPDVKVANAGNGHSSWAAPFTSGEIVDLEDTASGFCNIGVAKAENQGAGATGTKTVSFALASGQAGWGAWLLQVPAAPGGTTDVPVSDSATLSDSSAPTAAIPVTDSGTLSDSSSLGVGTPITASDAAMLTETSLVTAQTTGAEGTLSETSLIGIPVTDSGAMTDSSALSTGATDKAATDAGTFSDSSAPAAALTATDAGTAGDASSPAAAVAVTDSGAVSESSVVVDLGPVNPVTASDSAALTEAASITQVIVPPAGGGGGDEDLGDTSTVERRHLRASDFGVMLEAATVERHWSHRSLRVRLPASRPPAAKDKTGEVAEPVAFSESASVAVAVAGVDGAALAEARAGAKKISVDGLRDLDEMLRALTLAEML